MWNKTIDLVARQLDDIIHDYDVSLIVAKYYVQLRIDDSTKECQKYHNNKLNNNISFRECYFPLIRKGIVPLAATGTTYRHGPHSSTFKSWYFDFKSILRYLQSKRGFHQHYWSVYRSAWSIPYNPNEIITLKNKLKDINRLPESIITSHAFQTFDWLADV